MNHNDCIDWCITHKIANGCKKLTLCWGVVVVFVQSEANTERLITKHTSMRHVEGGWPKDVDFTEQVSERTTHDALSRENL